MLLGTQCVTDRDAVPVQISAAELDVVVNEINVGLGANKNTLPDVKPQPPADMSHEVARSRIIRTAGEPAVEILLIEAKTLGANTRLYFRLNPADLGCKHPVKVVENGTVRLKSSIDVLAGSPCNLAAHSNAVEEKEVAAENWVRAAPCIWDVNSGRVDGC